MMGFAPNRLLVLLAVLLLPGLAFAQPAAPSGVVVRPVAANAIDVTWSDNSNNEQRFVIFRRDGSGAFRLIARVDRNLTRFEDRNSGLQTQTEYCYQVSAENGSGESARAEACATIPNLPNSPSSTNAAQLSPNSTVELRWNDTSDNETGFRVFRSVDGASETELGDRPAGSERFLDSDIRADGEYCYTVASFNAAGLSGRSGESCADVEITPPALPTGIQAASVSGEEIEVSWSLPTFNYATLTVERSEGSEGPYEAVSAVEERLLSVIDGGLQPDTEYCYRISVENPKGSAGPTDPACARTAFVEPDLPADVAATGSGPQQITVTWDAPELRQHTYTIERALSPNGAFNQIANGIEAREFEDTNLDRRTRYCYRVRTVNPQFESGFTEPVCGFPQPAAVATLDAGPNGRDPANALDISWTPGGPTDNLSYLVSVRPQGGEFGRPQAVSGTSTTISGLPDGVRYDVRVQSVRSLEEAVAISEETDVVAQTHIRLWPGDTNGDGRVDAADATQLTSDLCFGATTSLSTDGSNVAWQASVFDFGDDDPVAVRCDADRNGSVDVFDFLAVAANAGRTTGTNQPAIAAQITSEAHRERVRRLLDGFTPRSPAQEALKEELRLLVGSSETPEVPGVPTLDTVYPNPFAQEATVRLGLPEETHVRVELYNTLGQRVAQVANDMRTAGWHTLKLDAATLPSGPYLLVVQAGPSVVTKRVTVIR